MKDSEWLGYVRLIIWFSSDKHSSLHILECQVKLLSLIIYKWVRPKHMRVEHFKVFSTVRFSSDKPSSLSVLRVSDEEKKFSNIFPQECHAEGYPEPTIREAHYKAFLARYLLIGIIHISIQV